MAKQHYCFLERFNNYFNRKVIRHESLEDYQNASKDFFIPTLPNGSMMPFDFNPNDNITTEIICNEVPFDPDYFLLLDAEGDIVSRWFVLEQKRNRQGQWLYILRRDVLSDSYTNIASAPLYVEKGIIKDLEDPLLLNNEDLNVSQIKKKEILLKDKTKAAWLVMYLKKGALGNNTIGPDRDGTITLNVPQNDAFVFETLSGPISSWVNYQYISNDYKVNSFSVFTVAFNNNESFPASNYKFKFWTDAPNASWTDGWFIGASNLYATGNFNDIVPNAYMPQTSDLLNKANTAFSYNASNGLMKYNDKIIKDSQGKYFKVKVYQSSNGATDHAITSAESPALKAEMQSIWNSAFSQSAAANDRAFSVKVNWIAYRITLEELTDLDTKVDFSAYDGNGTTDSMLFDVIAIPYGNVRITNPSEFLYGINTSPERSLAVMSSIATALTSQWVLDLQILPYCPIQELIYDTDEPTILFTNLTNKTALVGSRDNGGGGTEYTDAIFVCPSSNFTFDIEQKVEIEDDSDVSDNFKMKYVNDCTMIRICSPNYNGLFEMNLAKNGGLINRFNVDITMRPFNPYIHVNPDFNYLYGTDFNDVRGLICGGDFSLGIINDAWNVYEIQNKNYQAIFDRQIQNLDVNNAINMQEAKWGAVAGTVQGAGAGAVGGFMVGGGYGAVAGALLGGVASGIGGTLDIENLAKRQQEARSYAIDNYNLSLGNVRALPNSITKTSALTFNNKLFPFVEIYECSETEKEAYYLKIKYNGMKVGKIGTLESYRSEDNQNYFRAKLIRITDISEDNHYVETINEELMKGVFI